MTKEYCKELKERYGMEIMRHHITHEGQGLFLRTSEPIKELDDLTEKSDMYHVCTREQLGDEYDYKVYLPTDWFDLWGWA